MWTVTADKISAEITRDLYVTTGFAWGSESKHDNVKLYPGPSASARVKNEWERLDARVHSSLFHRKQILAREFKPTNVNWSMSNIHAGNRYRVPASYLGSPTCAQDLTGSLSTHSLSGYAAELSGTVAGAWSNIHSITCRTVKPLSFFNRLILYRIHLKTRIRQILIFR